MDGTPQLTDGGHDIEERPEGRFLFGLPQALRAQSPKPPEACAGVCDEVFRSCSSRREPGAQWRGRRCKDATSAAARGRPGFRAERVTAC
jgi:hypothetical protein